MIGGICHQKCLGEGFTEEESKFLKGQRDKEGKLLSIDRCERVVDYTVEGGTVVETRCSAYTDPDIFWRPGVRCPLASHYRPDLIAETVKMRVGQQKQKKRR